MESYNLERFTGGCIWLADSSAFLGITPGSSLLLGTTWLVEFPEVNKLTLTIQSVKSSCI